MNFQKRSLSKKTLGLGYSYRKPVIGKKNNFKNINPSKIASAKKIFLLILLLTFFGSGIYWMTLSGFFKIKKIDIQYEKFQEENEDLKTYFNKFIGKNLLFVNLDDSIKKIQETNPDLEKIEVSKNYPNTIQIRFSKYAIVANILLITEKENQKFIVNEAGYPVSSETENPNLPLIRVFSMKPAEEKKPVIRQENLQYVLKTIQYFEEKFGMKILDADYLVQAREIHLRTERFFGIWMDIQRSPEEQLTKLKKAIPRLDIYNTPLEYIDLRIAGTNGDKIIFKRTK